MPTSETTEQPHYHHCLSCGFGWEHADDLCEVQDTYAGWGTPATCPMCEEEE